MTSKFEAYKRKRMINKAVKKVLHSKTKVLYRLNGEPVVTFNKQQCIIGIYHTLFGFGIGTFFGFWIAKIFF